MNIQRALWLTVLSFGVSNSSPQVGGQCDPGGGLGGVGADLVVGAIEGPTSHGTASGYRAYSVGTGMCSIGTATVGWIANSPQHPVWTVNLYRLQGPRFEQIGYSWVRHGFFPLQQDACGCSCTPSLGSTALGIGCSTSNSANVNGAQSSLAARSDIPVPHLALHTGAAILSPPVTDLTSRRLRVLETDVDPTLHPGARYFLEVIVLAPDDAAAGNSRDNASYRELAAAGLGSLSTVGPIERQRLAIEGWAAADNSVRVVDLVDPDGARLMLGAKVEDHGNGTWTYFYSLENLNSSRGVSRFTVALPMSAVVSDTGFRGVQHHSGEIYDNDPWTVTVAPGAHVTWELAAGSSNALRWASMFSFSVTSNAPPSPTTLTLGLFTPGSPGEIQATVVGPGGNATAFVRGDCGGEGSTNIADAVLLLGLLFPPTGAPVTVSCRSACDANDDGALNIADVVALLGSLFGSQTVPLPPPLACGSDPTADGLNCATFAACP